MAKLKRKKQSIVFPANIVSPVASFLKAQLKMLEKRRRNVDEDDPFNDPERVIDNASPDTDAEEQFGHARSAAIKEQLDRKIIQTRRALARVKIGKYGICARCRQMIDTDRLIIYPEAIYCVKCSKKRREKSQG